MPEEDESGNVEYKLQLLPPSVDRFDRLVTQLSWRLTEGGGTCAYELGVRDDGALVGITLDDMRQSLSYLCAMAQSVGACVSLQRLVTKTSRSTSETSGFDELHVIAQASDVHRLLELQNGLPRADVIGMDVPTDALVIELDSNTSAVDVTLPYSINSSTQQLADAPHTAEAIDIPDSTKSKTPSTARRRLLDSRRDRRLARFEATIRAGAGLGDTPSRMDSLRRTSNLHAPEHAGGSLRFLAEAVITQDQSWFVDYTSL